MQWFHRETREWQSEGSMQDSLHFRNVRSVDSGSRLGVATSQSQRPQERESDSDSEPCEGRYDDRPSDGDSRGWPFYSAGFVMVEGALQWVVQAGPVSRRQQESGVDAI